MNLVQITNRVEISFWSITVNVMNDPRTTRALSVVMVIVFCLGMIFLSVGLWAQFGPGWLAGRVEVVHTTTTKYAEPVEQNVQRQYNTLVILVDQVSSDADSQPVQIQGIWLAAYLTSTAKLNLVPVYPGGSIDDSVEYANLRMGSDGALEPEFFQSLQSLDVRWDHYVVIESSGFQELVLLIGDEEPVYVNTKQPDDVVAHQAAQAHEICHHAGEFFRSGDADKLVQIFEGHIYSDLAPTHVLELWRQRLSGRSRISCEFPTLGDVVPAQYAAQY